MASEVERVVLLFDGVELAKVEGRTNPITGQHVEIIAQPKSNTEIDKGALKKFLESSLEPHMTPKRIKIGPVSIGHRFKRS